MTDLSKSQVHGPVKELRTEFAEWDLAKEEWQPPRNFHVTRFLPGGQVSET